MCSFFDTYRDKLKQAADNEKIKSVLESHGFYFQKAADKFDEFNMRGEQRSAWNSVFEENRESCCYWWLNANPKIWGFCNIEVGQQVDYTSVNENGNQRKAYKNFEDVRVGDFIIGYESYPVKAIVSPCRISKAHDGERIWIEKLENLVTPVEYAKRTNGNRKQSKGLQKEFCRPLLIK